MRTYWGNPVFYKKWNNCGIKSWTQCFLYFLGETEHFEDIMAGTSTDVGDLSFAAFFACFSYGGWLVFYTEIGPYNIG